MEQQQQREQGRRREPMPPEPIVTLASGEEAGWKPPGVELAAALLKAQREVKAAIKTGENKHHGYRYVPAEEIIIIAREALDSAELVIIPQASDWIDGQGEIMGGAAGHLRACFLVVHAPTAQGQVCTLDVAVCPTRAQRDGGWSRPLDKAEFATMTEILGYFFRGLFLIPRKNAPDVSGRKDGGETKGRGYGRGDEERPASPPPAQGGAQRPTRPALSVEGWVTQIGRADSVEALSGLYRAARAALARDPDELKIDDAAADVLVRRLEAAPREGLEELSRFSAQAQLRGPALARVREAAVAAARRRDGGAS